MGKVRGNGRRRHELRSSVIEPVVIPPEYENDSTRGKGRPVIDVDSDPWQKFIRWLQRVENNGHPFVLEVVSVVVCGKIAASCVVRLLCACFNCILQP